MIPALKTGLESLGLNEKQIAVLSVLLKKGQPILVSSIAHAADLNRTTTYDILKELGGKGLVSHVERRGAMRYQAIAAELLPAYVERRREQLKETKERFEQAIPQLKLLQAHGNTLPQVQFFEGLEGVKQAYEDTLENNKEKKLFDFTGTDAIYQKMGTEWLEYYWKKRSRLGIECSVLAPDTEWSRLMQSEDRKYKRTTRLISKEFPFESEIDIYDDKVGIFTFSQERPIAVIIQDSTINSTLKAFFKLISLQAK